MDQSHIGAHAHFIEAPCGNRGQRLMRLLLLPSCIFVCGDHRLGYKNHLTSEKGHPLAPPQVDNSFPSDNLSVATSAIDSAASRLVFHFVDVGCTSASVTHRDQGLVRYGGPAPGLRPQKPVVTAPCPKCMHRMCGSAEAVQPFSGSWRGRMAILDGGPEPPIRVFGSTNPFVWFAQDCRTVTRKADLRRTLPGL